MATIRPRPDSGKRGIQPATALGRVPPRRTPIPRTTGELLPTWRRDAEYAPVVEYGERRPIPPPGPPQPIDRGTWRGAAVAVIVAILAGFVGGFVIGLVL